MKAIHSLVTVVKGDTITITGKIMDVTFPMFVGQRSTIMHPVNGNMNHPRHLQVNTHGAMMTRNGNGIGVLFPKDELASVLMEVDSRLTNAPVFLSHPDSKNPIGNPISELPLTATIQESKDGEIWTDVKNPKKFKPVSGKHYRCKASNSVGESHSKSFHHK